MAASKSQTINLGLPAVPETTDAKLFLELVRVYNSINILAQTLDGYTIDGSIGASLAIVSTQLAQVNNLLEGFIDNSSEFAELKKTGLFGTLTSKGAFGCNGKTAQAAYALPVASTDLPTVITLANALRAMAIANGIGV
jgi:hypothetical protein